jgi:DNA-binding NarL/FixJ family response regulator
LLLASGSRLERKRSKSSIARLRSEGKNVTQIARALKISRESVYRIEREIKAVA